MKLSYISLAYVSLAYVTYNSCIELLALLHVFISSPCQIFVDCLLQNNLR